LENFFFLSFFCAFFAAISMSGQDGKKGLSEKPLTKKNPLTKKRVSSFVARSKGNYCQHLSHIHENTLKRGQPFFAKKSHFDTKLGVASVDRLLHDRGRTYFFISLLLLFL
jgi:hypothetical protein